MFFCLNFTHNFVHFDIFVIDVLSLITKCVLMPNAHSRPIFIPKKIKFVSIHLLDIESTLTTNLQKRADRGYTYQIFGKYRSYLAIPMIFYLIHVSVDSILFIKWTKSVFVIVNWNNINSKKNNNKALRLRWSSWQTTNMVISVRVSNLRWNRSNTTSVLPLYKWNKFSVKTDLILLENYS